MVHPREYGGPDHRQVGQAWISDRNRAAPRRRAIRRSMQTVAAVVPSGRTPQEFRNPARRRHRDGPHLELSRLTDIRRRGHRLPLGIPLPRSCRHATRRGLSGNSPTLTYGGFQSSTVGPASGRVSPEFRDAVATPPTNALGGRLRMVVVDALAVAACGLPPECLCQGWRSRRRWRDRAMNSGRR